MGNHKMSIRRNLEKPLDARSISQTPNFKLQTSNFKTKSQTSNSNPKSQISHLNLQTSNHKPQILNLKPPNLNSQISGLHTQKSQISHLKSSILNQITTLYFLSMPHIFENPWTSLTMNMEAVPINSNSQFTERDCKSKVSNLKV